MRAELLHDQRVFMAALRAPLRGESRRRSSLVDPDAPWGPESEGTPSFIRASGARSASESFELYRRQYWYRLLDSLEEDFPLLARVLGRSAFWRLIEAYLSALPSRSFTLRHLGRGLADFIRERPAELHAPQHAEDIARFEYALCSTFEAASVSPLPAEALKRQPIALQAHLHLLRLRSPVDVLHRRAAKGQRPSVLWSPAPRKRHVVMYREGLQIRYERLPLLAFAILEAIAETQSLEAAMERIASGSLTLRGSDIPRVRAWFAQWAARGWFRSAEGIDPSRSKEK